MYDIAACMYDAMRTTHSKYSNEASLFVAYAPVPSPCRMMRCDVNNTRQVNEALLLVAYAPIPSPCRTMRCDANSTQQVQQ